MADKLRIRTSKDDEYQLKPVDQILINFIWISLKVGNELRKNGKKLPYEGTLQGVQYQSSQNVL